MSSKGPPPRLDLSKKNLEELRESDYEKSPLSISQHASTEESDTSDNNNGESSAKSSVTEDDDILKEESGSPSSTERKKKKPVMRTSSKSLSSSPHSSDSSFMLGNIRPRDTQTLLLSNNKLTKLPADFFIRFEELRALFMDHNQLTEFPVVICNLPHLEKLQYNNIDKLPKELKNLKHTLKKFYVNNNQLTSLPEELGELSDIEVLDIRNNQISVLPVQLAGSTQLQEFSIHNNPIHSPPPFIYNKGIVHLLRYMREIRESLEQDTPTVEFIFVRKISFTEAKKNLKRSQSKVLTRNQSAVADQKDSKTINAAMRKSSTVFRELIEDAIFINQNQLLYYLTDYHAHETCGRRDYMEDRCIALPRLRQSPPKGLLEEVVNMFSKVGFFAIYDGHGGDKCADFMIQNLHKNICNQAAFARGEFESALRTGFKLTDEAFLQRCREYNLIDGSTCLVVILIDNQLIAAHAGDSRAVLCRDKKAIRLTEDHKPDRVDELARIEELGGEVLFRGNCFRVSGDLAMSRSFGDLRLKDPKPLVISDPEIRVEELTPKDEFIILASDGLWDVISDQKAVEIVKKCSNVEEASRKLVETALALGTMDNTTVIVIKLDWCIDFITQDEIEGRVDSSKVPEKKPPKEEIKPAESPQKAVASFRNSLESFNTDREQLPKGIYPQVSSSGIKLKVLIPSLEATKLMKFDTNTTIQEIKKAILLKHRFTDPSECFQIYHKEDEKEDQLLEEEKTVADFSLKDMDIVELRRIGSPSRRPSIVEGNPFAFSEALPGSNEAQAESISQAPPTVKDSAKRSHRVTALWSAESADEQPQKRWDTEPTVWKVGVIPDSPRRPRNKSVDDYQDEEEAIQKKKKKKKGKKSSQKKHKKKSDSSSSAPENETKEEVDSEKELPETKETEDEDHNDENESVE